MDNSDPELTEGQSLLIKTLGRLRILILNRPSRMNALTPDLHRSIQAAVFDAAMDDEVHALLITGAGRAFCAGGDIKASSERARQTRETGKQRAESLRQHGQTVIALNQMPKITIAYINGVAAGAGLALALACDLRIASREAVLKTAYSEMALSGDLGVSYFLAALVGPSKAKELMILSEKISAQRAFELGMINRLVDTLDQDNFDDEWIQKISNGPAIAFQYIKQNILMTEVDLLKQVIDLEADNSIHCLRTEDCKEAAAAFREKRKPRFHGQ